MEVHLVTDMLSGVEIAENSKPGIGLDEQLVAQLLSSAMASGLKLTGEGGVLQRPGTPDGTPRPPDRDGVRTPNDGQAGYIETVHPC